jgi:integrase/recombinase XerD
METTKPQITLSRAVFNDIDVCLIRFDFNKLINERLRTVTGAYWNQHLGCWCGPLTRFFFNQLVARVGDIADIIYGPKESNATYSNNYVNAKTKKLEQDAATNAIPEIAKKDLERWSAHIKGKQYADNTVSVYIGAMRLFLVWLGQRSHKEVRKGDIDEYMSYLVIQKKVSRSYQNQHVNAIKLFYKFCFSIHLSSDMIARPRREYKLPHYLTREEVARIFATVKNTKHKCILSLIYACGLRVGELIRIQLTDIDPAQRLLMVRQSKGNKDRVIPIPESLLNILNEYANAYKPQVYLFEGEQPRNPYTERSVQAIFKQAVIRSGIRNLQASPHWLRHSYATHIMEMGTNVRDLQTLLGHKNLKTTEIYTHISSTNFNRIISPFDTLPETKSNIELPPKDQNSYF